MRFRKPFFRPSRNLWYVQLDGRQINPEEAFAITKRLAAEHPTGPLFRNTDGLPWTPFSLNCRFGRIKKKLGKKYSLYAVRHSFATRALQNGVDAITTANLLGHVDLTMLKRVYEHVDKDARHMHDAARKASGG